jgi:hypothetical protein
LSNPGAAPTVPAHRYAGKMKMIEQGERLTPLSVRVLESTKRELTQLAKADRRSLALYVQMLLEEHIAAKKGKAGGKRK